MNGIQKESPFIPQKKKTHSIASRDRAVPFRRFKCVARLHMRVSLLKFAAE